MPWLQSEEDDGTWASFEAYTHKETNTVGFWYGDESFEGMGDGYSWAECSVAGKHTRVADPPGRGAPVCVIDRAGNALPVRWAPLLDKSFALC